MGGNVYKPSSFAGSTGGSFNPASYDFMQDYSKTPGFGLDAQKYGIDPSLSTVGQQGSAFGGLFGSDSFGQGGFMSSMPGYILGGLSYLEAKKNNKLSRKERNYNLARKQTEDAAYDKYKNNWEGIKFS